MAVKSQRAYQAVQQPVSPPISTKGAVEEQIRQHRQAGQECVAAGLLGHTDVKRVDSQQRCGRQPSGLRVEPAAHDVEQWQSGRAQDGGRQADEGLIGGEADDAQPDEQQPVIERHVGFGRQCQQKVGQVLGREPERDQLVEPEAAAAEVPEPQAETQQADHQE